MNDTATPRDSATVPAMLPASTEIPADVSAYVDQIAKDDDRSRAYVLRHAIKLGVEAMKAEAKKKSRR